MRLKCGIIIVFGLILFFAQSSIAIAPVPLNENIQYIAILTGDEVIPPQNTGASGKAFFGVNEDLTQLTYRIEVYNLYDVLMATIHLGFPGKEGPLVVWLFPESPPPTPLKIKGRFDGVLAEGIITHDRLVGRLYGQPLSALIQEIKNGRVFIQVDTLLHQIGELRGQIEPLFYSE